MAKNNRVSKYAKYHEEIKKLLSEGTTIQDVHGYLEEKYKIGLSYNGIWQYIHANGLEVYVQEKVKNRYRGGRGGRGVKRGKPEGCTYPNCFECILADCAYYGEIATNIDGEKLYDMSKVLLERR